MYNCLLWIMRHNEYFNYFLKEFLFSITFCDSIVSIVQHNFLKCIFSFDSFEFGTKLYERSTRDVERVWAHVTMIKNRSNSIKSMIDDKSQTIFKYLNEQKSFSDGSDRYERNWFNSKKYRTKCVIETIAETRTTQLYIFPILLSNRWFQCVKTILCWTVTIKSNVNTYVQTYLTLFVFLRVKSCFCCSTKLNRVGNGVWRYDTNSLVKLVCNAAIVWQTVLQLGLTTPVNSQRRNIFSRLVYLYCTLPHWSNR